MSSFDDFEEPPNLEIDDGPQNASLGGVNEYDDDIGASMGHGYLADSSFDDDDPLSDAPNMEGMSIDVSPEAHATPAPKATAATQQTSPVKPPINTQPLQDGSESAPENTQSDPQPDEYEVRLLAKFGPVPDAWWQTPTYAWVVWKRSRVLRGLLDQATASLKSAQAELDQWLTDFGQRVWPNMQQSPLVSEFADALQRVQQTIDERSERLKDAETAVSAQIEQIASQISSAQASSAQNDQELRAAQEAFTLTDTHLKRAVARRKRAEIELRNAKTVAQGQALPPAEESRLESEIKLRRQEELEPQAAWDQANAVLRSCRQERDRIEHQLKDLKQQLHLAQTAHADEMATRSEGVRKALSEQATLFRQAALRLIEREPSLLTPSDRDAFQALDGAVAQQVGRIQLLEHALASADKLAVKRGRLFALGMAGGVVLLLLLVIMTFARSEPTQPTDVSDDQIWTAPP